MDEPLENELSEERPELNVSNLGSCGTQSPLELEPGEIMVDEPEDDNEAEDDDRDDDEDELAEPRLQLPITVEHGVGGKASG